MSVRLFLKDNTTGGMHEYGTDKHDSLIVNEDGSLHYYNIQNGCGTLYADEGYSFCLEDGTVPNPLLEEETLDIAGDGMEKTAHWEKIVEQKPVFDENGNFMDVVQKEKTRCSRCKRTNKNYEPPYCPHCGARMRKER